MNALGSHSHLQRAGNSPKLFNSENMASGLPEQTAPVLYAVSAFHPSRLCPGFPAQSEGRWAGPCEALC